MATTTTQKPEGDQAVLDLESLAVWKGVTVAFGGGTDESEHPEGGSWK